MLTIPRIARCVLKKMKFAVFCRLLLCTCLSRLLVIAQNVENVTEIMVRSSNENCSSSKRSPRNSSMRQDVQNSTTNSSGNQNFSCPQGSCPDQLGSSYDYTIESARCYCDAYCQSFQDCCNDYWNSGNASKHERSSTKIKEDFLQPWSCVSLGDERYWMKNKCFKSWPHDEVESLCVNQPSRINSSTYFDLIPVLGVQDNITYRNRHCARCNHQDNFENWEVSMPLNFQPVGIQSMGDLIDFLLEFANNHSIRNSFVPKSDMPRRYCNSTCSRHSVREVTFDFYLTINFRHQFQSRGYSVNYICPKRVYDHHLKACVDSDDIVAPIDAVLDKYKIAIWFYSSYSFCDNRNITNLQSCFTDVEPGNIFNAVLKNVELQNAYMVTFDVQLTLNQSIDVLKNYSDVKRDSANVTSYSIVKFIKPFTTRFSLFIGSQKVTVIKTTSRQLGCIGLKVFNASDYTALEHGKIYVHETRRNYTRDQYFKVDSTKGLVGVCEKQLPSDCTGFHMAYDEEEFEVRANLSLYHKLRGELYQFGEYSLQKNQVYICHIALRDSSDSIRGYMTIIGLSLSIFCSMLVLVTYITFSQLRNLPGKNIINLMVGLVMLDLVWLLSPQAVRIGPLCTATAFVIQYFMLFVHLSMAKIAYDTLSMFTDPIAHQRKNSTSQAKCFLIVWSIPLVFVVICCVFYYCNVLDIQFTKSCWLSGKHVFAIVYIPVCLAVAFNIIWFTRSILKMRKHEKNRQMLRAQKQEKRLVGVHLKIATVVGLGWASAFLAVLFPIFSYVFVILTAFQGVYIFLAFACKRNVLAMWKNLFLRKAEKPMLVQSETKV